MSREKMVKQAEQWLGLKESGGSYQVILDTYNKQSPLPRGHKMVKSDDWCAAFVTACAVATGMTKYVPCECSCNKMISIAKDMGVWVEDDAYKPEPGDIMLYDWDDSGKGDCTGQADHVGIVQKVVGSTIYVIEGNYSDAVKVRQIAVNGRYIRGYIVPQYPVEKPDVGNANRVQILRTVEALRAEADKLEEMCK